MNYLKYVDDVLSGRIVAGKYIQQSCERFNAFKDKYEFREDEVGKVIQFISILRHYTGRHAGKHFNLEPWQQFIIASVYGFYQDGERVTKSAYIEMARKNGKTAFAAALCLYHLIADGEMDAEVDLAANSKEQAKIAFRMASTFTKGIDPKGKSLEPYRDKIKFDKMLSVMNVFAADDSKLDGFNASMWLLDEYHAAKNGKLKDVLQSSQGMRDNPMGIIITTAGFDKLSPCYEFRTMSVEILSGLKSDDSLFIAIYSLDEGDDWKDKGKWIKSNPNIGVTVKPSFIEEQVRKAINSPSEEVGVKTKTINLWVDASDVWIPDTYVIGASKDINYNQFKDAEVYAGIDLSSTSDLTCVAYMIPKGEKFYFIVNYYLPEAALSEKRFKETYSEWRRRGLLTITPGNVTDYDYILNDLNDKSNHFYLNSIAYDPWNATQFVISATERGLNMVPYAQNLGNFNRPTKEMERLILSGNAVIDNNIINRHCFRNVVMARDANGNIKPSKKFEEKKIDGVIAMLEALGSFLSNPRYSATL